jgi:hypothetical protein
VPPNESRQLTTNDFLATVDFAYVGNADQAGGAGRFFITPLEKLLKALRDAATRVTQATAPYGDSPANSGPELHVSYTSGPVTLPNQISVDVSNDGNVLFLATRSASGTCWYMVQDQEEQPGNGGLIGVPTVSFSGVFSSASGLVEQSCSAEHPLTGLIAY